MTRLSFPPAKRGRDNLRGLVRGAVGLILGIVIGSLVFQLTAALVGATLAAVGMDPSATDGWADLAGVFACGLLLVALYVRRVP